MKKRPNAAIATGVVLLGAVGFAYSHSGGEVAASHDEVVTLKCGDKTRFNLMNDPKNLAASRQVLQIVAALPNKKGTTRTTPNFSAADHVMGRASMEVGIGLPTSEGSDTPYVFTVATALGKMAVDKPVNMLDPEELYFEPSQRHIDHPFSDKRYHAVVPVPIAGGAQYVEVKVGITGNDTRPDIDVRVECFDRDANN